MSKKSYERKACFYINLSLYTETINKLPSIDILKDEIEKTIGKIEAECELEGDYDLDECIKNLIQNPRYMKELSHGTAGYLKCRREGELFQRGWDELATLKTKFSKLKKEINKDTKFIETSIFVSDNIDSYVEEFDL